MLGKLMDWLALASGTVNGALVAAVKFASAALVTVSVQLPDTSLTETVVPETLQPVEPVELKVNAPVPLPPDAVAVPVVPNVTALGAVTVSVAWVAFATVKLCVTCGAA